MIRAPFNFVPLDANIFFPSWSNRISHDIPFKENNSGIIHVTIKAETPIFTRNGHPLDTDDNEFSYIRENGKRVYFIPGTSLKGCIRSVLEIMSFGKMQPVTDSHTEKNYEHSPKVLEELRQKESADLQHIKQGSLDLAECIFGTTNDNSKIRGRVHFSHFRCVKEEMMPLNSKEFKIVLNIPNPSVLPLYVCQDGTSYIDYDNEELYPDEILRGWKRYVLRSGYWTKKPGKDNVITTFRPLNKGSVFKGAIRYHNLKKEELGALLCALTWNGEEGCYHHLGQAKPFGFGRVSIRLDDISIQELNSYIETFKDMISVWLKDMTEGGTPTWRNYKPIRELFTLAKTVEKWDDKRFYYMEGKDSKLAKKNKEYLLPLSEILKNEK